MQLTTASRAGKWLVISVSGDLDAVGGPKLRGQVMLHISKGSPFQVLDLGGVDLIDSIGLGAIVGALRRTRLSGGDLRLVVPKPRLRKVFEICDLDRVFELHSSVAEATAPQDPPPLP